jgi:hypothetical protein
MVAFARDMTSSLSPLGQNGCIQPRGSRRRLPRLNYEVVGKWILNRNLQICKLRMVTSENSYCRSFEVNQGCRILVAFFRDRMGILTFVRVPGWL